MDFCPIHHIAVIASNYDKAMAFYVDALGLRVLRDSSRPDKGDRKVDLDLGGGMELELFIKPDSPSRPSYPEARGLRHVAFAVPDVEQAVQALEQRGICCEPIRIDPYTGKKATFFHDPDSLPLELYEK